MRSTRCAFNAAAALHRIFIAPTELPALRQLPRAAPRHAAAQPLNFHRQYRAPTRDSVLKDDDIESLNFTHVHLVNEDSSLSPPQLLRDILNGLDKKTHTLVAVQVPPPSLRSRFDAPPTTPAEGGPPTIPICRIVDRKAARDEKKAAKSKKASNPALTLKTIELNWAIDAHDLDYRLKQLKGFLEKGYRVDVMLTGKRKKRRATPEEAKHTMERVRQAIEECEGAREWKDIEGKLGGQMMVYAEGSKKEAAA